MFDVRTNLRFFLRCLWLWIIQLFGRGRRWTLWFWALLGEGRGDSKQINLSCGMWVWQPCFWLIHNNWCYMQLKRSKTCIWCGERLKACVVPHGPRLGPATGMGRHHDREDLLCFSEQRDDLSPVSRQSQEIKDDKSTLIIPNPCSDWDFGLICFDYVWLTCDFAVAHNSIVFGWWNLAQSFIEQWWQASNFNKSSEEWYLRCVGCPFEIVFGTLWVYIRSGLNLQYKMMNSTLNTAVEIVSHTA